MGLGVVGLDFQGLPVMGDGLVDLSAAGQGDAEVVVGLGVVGLDFQGLPVMGDGLVDLSAAGQGDSEVVVGPAVDSDASRPCLARARTHLGNHCFAAR